MLCALGIVGLFAFVSSNVAAVHVRKNSLDMEATICSKDINHHCCTHNVKATKNPAEGAPPMVVFSAGCSGSSAVMIMVKDIAEQSNHSVWDCDGGFELLADLDKGYYGKLRMSSAVKSFLGRAADAKRQLLFKAEERLAEKDAYVMQLLHSMHAKVVNFDRVNKLDVALCAVHDCFQHFTSNPIGYQVNTTGKPVSNCEFRGRGDTQAEEETKIKVNTKFLVENLKKLMKNRKWTDTYLKSKGFYKPAFATYEELFMFNHGGEMLLHKSVLAWMKLMESLGVQTKYSVVHDYLSGIESDHTPAPKHSSMIYNFDEVKRAIETCDGEGCDEIKHMLRE